MKVLEQVVELRSERPSWGQVGLVPTMGYLHDGHLSLLRTAREQNDTVVMSLFVNPTQFGPREDLATYPRDIPRDLYLASSVGTDVVFMPAAAEVYPAGFDTWVEPGALAQRWEGERRPGHFRGVATVVLKLLQMVQPQRAYFGEKDFQQLAVVKRMTSDFNLPAEIVRCPTVREASGLALSSRNAHLSDQSRRQAATLSRALFHAQRLAAGGERDVPQLLAEMHAILAEVPSLQVDYLAIVDAASLEPLERLGSSGRIIAAAFLDGVRLIDNCEIVAPEQAG
jgi:pantoate--beta-alanine ligase